MHEFIDSLLREIAAIGATPEGGASRLAFSPEDQQVRRLFARHMHESGLNVREDAFGNLFARLEGTCPEAPVVATGSHLDTVPDGGNYDGVLGCVTGLAVLRELARRQTHGAPRLTHPLECIAFQNEESTRFASSTLGSRMLCGADPAALLRLADAQGNSLAALLTAVGLDPARAGEAALPPGYCKAFIELHMDQGPTLEDAAVPLGIITHIVGVRRAKVSFTGSASHAGGTPMLGRRDALVSAAEAVLAMQRIAAGHEGRHSMVGTVGRLVVTPGAINVIPGQAELYCELRATDAACLQTAWSEFVAALEAIAAARQTPLHLRLTESSPPVPMAESVRHALHAACSRLQIPCMDMASGAGHDCMNMAAISSAGMLFVRSRNGLSHHPDEFVRPDDVQVGYQTLFDTLSALAV